MRFPHIIAENTRIAYTPSPAALELEGEINRKVKAEDFEWDKDLCPPLSTLCIRAIAKNFKNEQLLDELPCEDRLHLLEILPTDLELEIVVPLIEVKSDDLCHIFVCNNNNWFWIRVSRMKSIGSVDAAISLELLKIRNIWAGRGSVCIWKNTCRSWSKRRNRNTATKTTWMIF